MPNTNKVKFGIKNVYFAVATIADDGTATYGTPKPLRGAVSISLEAQGEMTQEYADDIVYYTSSANSGYQGDLELELVPEDFLKDILGFKVGGNGILYEDADAEPVHFALTFEFSGDKHKKRGVLYNCTATRPAVASSTVTATKEVQHESITITATSVYNDDVDSNVVKGSAVPTDSVYANWNTAIQQPTAAE